MKRIIKEIVLIFIVLISCSCAKDETIMTINSDKSMNLEINIGYGINSDKTIDVNKLKDNVSSLGFFIDSYHDDKFTGYRLTKKYDNINKVSANNNASINLAEIINGKFNDKKLFKVKKGFFKNTYTANFTYDFRELYDYKLKIYLFGQEGDKLLKDLEESIFYHIESNNIEVVKYDIVPNMYNFNLLVNTLSKLKKDYQGIPVIFVGDKIFDFQNKNLESDVINEIQNILDNKIKYTDIINEDYDDSYEIIYKVNLPSKNINNNATEVTNDGKTLIWKGNYFDENNIEFSFTIFNKSSIIIIVFIILTILISIFIGCIFYRRYQKDKEKFISKNTNIDNIIPKTDENNQITSINELINK